MTTIYAVLLCFSTVAGGCSDTGVNAGTTQAQCLHAARVYQSYVVPGSGLFTRCVAMSVPTWRVVE